MRPFWSQSISHMAFQSQNNIVHHFSSRCSLIVTFLCSNRLLIGFYVVELPCNREIWVMQIKHCLIHWFIPLLFFPQLVCHKESLYDSELKLKAWVTLRKGLVHAIHFIFYPSHGPAHACPIAIIGAKCFTLL